jgi:hypothetical protein
MHHAYATLEFKQVTNPILDGGTFSSGAFKTEAITLATAKVVTPAWHQIFLRGILANWLVTMAVFLSISSREIISKIVAIWFPTMAFTALGADHVIANMFYIPLGIFSGAPQLSVGLYIWKSMIPAGLGNIVGGGLFVGVLYWYLYLTDKEVEIPFDVAAYEQGGQIRRINKPTTPDSAMTGAEGTLRGSLVSGVARELHVEHFKNSGNRNGGDGAV